MTCMKLTQERPALCPLECGIEPREAAYFSNSALAVSTNATIHMLLYIAVDYYFVRARKFYIRRNNNKIDSIETGHIVIADLLP